MAKIIKLTEEDINKVIRQKIQEALEHNVDLEYSPAIGNKKRGPGKETMDQMKKRKNTKLDEDIDERDIYRRLSGGDYDYDGDDGEGYDSGKRWITLGKNAYEYAFDKVFGQVPDNMDEYLSEHDLPEDIEVSVSISTESDSGDYWTPPYSESKLEDWEMLTKIDDLDEKFQKVVRLAAEYEVESMDPSEFIDNLYESKSGKYVVRVNESKKKNKYDIKTIRLTESQLQNVILESVKSVLNEVNTLTAFSAEEKARRKLKELINNGQGNSAEAAKLRRQIETFESYNEMNDDGGPNKFGRTGADMAQDFMNAGGVKGTGQEYIDADNAYRNNNKQYGGNMTQRQMNLHQQMSTQMNQNTYDSANKRMYTPQEMGYTYQAPKKGFMGIGKQKGGWVYNKQQQQ